MPGKNSDTNPFDEVDDEQLSRILAVADEYGLIIDQGEAVTGFNIIDDGSPELTAEEIEAAFLSLAALKRFRDSSEA